MISFENSVLNFKQMVTVLICTVLPVKSDSDVMFCLQLLSKTFTCTLHLSKRNSRDHSVLQIIYGL